MYLKLSFTKLDGSSTDKNEHPDNLKSVVLRFSYYAMDVTAFYKADRYNFITLIETLDQMIEYAKIDSANEIRDGIKTLLNIKDHLD